MPEPQVQLDFTVHWCAKHLEPFRASWPVGAATAMLALFDAAARHEDIRNYAGGDSDRMNAVLREFSPLCCFLGEETMSEIYMKALGREPRK